MTVTIPIQTIKLSPGSQITITDLSWTDLERVLTDLGENRNTRITYYQGALEIMSPLAVHERYHRIIADIVKAILDFQSRNWEDFGSTTLKRSPIAGIEPDTCLYIQNVARVQGCTNLSLADYPPPDLAIESDVTSKTTLDVYHAIAVPEVWIYRRGELKIYLLSDSCYLEVSTSPTFPHLPLKEMIPKKVEQAIEHGTSQMLRQLKTEL